MAPPTTSAAASGPVRPALVTTRTASMRDPPSRPARPLVKPDQGAGVAVRPGFSAKLGFRVPPPLPTPPPIAPADNGEGDHLIGNIISGPDLGPEGQVVVEQIVQALEEGVVPQVRPVTPEQAPPTPVAPPAIMAASSPAVVQPVLHPPTDLVTPANPRPVSVMSTQAGSGASGNKRPAVLQKRGAAAAAAGQVQGFAPTRRRPGVTEPTLSQMAKQKPTKTFVPAVKKPDLPPPPPPAAPKKIIHAQVSKEAVMAASSQGVPKAAPRKVGGVVTLKADSAPAGSSTLKVVQLPPAPIPPEVLIAAQIPLPAVTPEEVPLPPELPEEVPLPPVMSDERADPPIEVAEEHLPPVPTDEVVALANDGLMDRWHLAENLDSTPRQRQAPRSCFQREDLLVDFDTTIIMPPRRASATATAQSLAPVTVVSDECDLLDFDMSVVLPPDFAPMSAVAPRALAVLRDPVPMANPAKHLPPYKFKLKEFGDDEPSVLVQRVALSEREVNTL